MVQTHVIKLPKRTGILTITQEPDRILVKLTFDRYGFFGDEEAIKEWLGPLFEQYDNDKRPLVMKNPTTGEIATIFGNKTSGFMLVEVPPEM